MPLMTSNPVIRGGRIIKDPDVSMGPRLPDRPWLWDASLTSAALPAGHCCEPGSRGARSARLAARGCAHSGKSLSLSAPRFPQLENGEEDRSRSARPKAPGPGPQMASWLGHPALSPGPWGWPAPHPNALRRALAHHR